MAVGRLARAVSLLSCLLLAFHINANEIWAARQLGLRLHWWHLPRLVKRTRAPFKRRVFGLLHAVWRGTEPSRDRAHMILPNRIAQETPVRGEQAFVYGFKARAQRHHCLGYGTFSVDVGSLGDFRKEYSRRSGRSLTCRSTSRRRPLRCGQIRRPTRSCSRSGSATRSSALRTWT